VMSAASDVTYWTRTLTLQQIALGLGLSLLTFLFCAFVMGSVLLAAILVLVLMWGFGMAARVRVRTTLSGIEVVNASKTIRVTWARVERFAIRDRAGDQGWDVVLEARLRVPLSVDVLRGPRVKPRTHEAWARATVAELNAEIERRRLRDGGRG
jgi:hypothetical protein